MNNIIKKSLQWTCFFSLALIAFSCKTTKDTAKTMGAKADTATMASDYGLEDALLWEISGKGLQQPSYLFGTIHLIDKESFYWPKGVLSAFESAEAVAFEIDMNQMAMDDMADMGSMMSIMTKAFMADGKTLKDLYSAEDYKVVKDHFADQGLPMMLLERIKPMFLTVFASGDVEMGKGLADQASTKSYEMELFSLAQDSDKPVSGLETIEYQMSVFDSIPLDTQASMLLETIKSSDTEDDAFKEMIQMYVDQKINDMVSFVSDDEMGIAGFEDVLLYTRNKNWIPVMEDKMKSQRYFFAVGAGHLAGKDGVIDLLKKTGYTLKPLSHK